MRPGADERAVGHVALVAEDDVRRVGQVGDVEDGAHEVVEVLEVELDVTFGYCSM